MRKDSILGTIILDYFHYEIVKGNNGVWLRARNGGVKGNFCSEAFAKRVCDQRNPVIVRGILQQFAELNEV